MNPPRDEDLLPDEAAPLEGKKGDEAPPDDGEKPEAAKDAAAGDEAAAAEQPKDEPPRQPAAPAAEAAPEADKPPAFVPKLEGTPPPDYADQRKALRKQVSEARTKYDSGEMTQADFETIEAEAQDRLDDLLVQRTRAETLKDANEQIQRQAQADAKAAFDTVIAAVKAQGKAAGFDYDDTADGAVRQRQFNAQLDVLEVHPAWRDKGFAEQAAEAHRQVLAMNGKAPAAAAAPAPPAEKKPRDVPQTLAGLPAAGGMPIGNDLMSTLAAENDPDRAEELWERTPPAQREAIRRASTRQH